MTRVGFFGLLGSGNLGNDGSLEAVLSFVRDRRPDASLTAMCAGPDRVTARYGFPAIALHWFDTQRPSGAVAPILKTWGKLVDVVRTVRFVRRCDVVVVPGMGVLEATLPLRPWGWPYSLFLLCAAGRLLGTPVALVGVGAAEIKAPLTRTLVGWSARLARHRSYRDDISRDALQDMGVDTTGDEVHPDLAFALTAPPPAARVPGSVGLGVMAYYGSNDDRARAGEIHAAYLAALTCFVRRLLDDGRQVRMFTGDRVDEEVVAAVLADLRRTRPGLDPTRVVAEPVDTIDQLMQQIRTVDVVVASRYHNVLSSLKLCKPTVAVGYGAKNDVLMAQMGMAQYCQSITSLDVDRLVGQLAELEEHRDQVVATLAERNAENTRRLDATFDKLSALL